MGLVEDVGAGPVGLDTAPFIYLTNDKDLPPIAGIQILQVNSYLPSAPPRPR